MPREGGGSSVGAATYDDGDDEFVEGAVLGGGHDAVSVEAAPGRDVVERARVGAGHLQGVARRESLDPLLSADDRRGQSSRRVSKVARAMRA